MQEKTSYSIMIAFARGMSWADRNAIRQQIIDSRDSEAIIQCAQEVPGANIALLQQGVLNSKRKFG